MSGSGVIATVPTGTNGAGRYPTSGDNFWNTSTSLVVTLSAPVAAFGFYGVDIGDFNGQVTVTTDSTFYNVGNTLNGLGGAVLFWGVIDTANPFSTITFGNTNSGTDVFGFDQMTVGDVQQVVAPFPEPSTWTLLGSALAGICFLRRRMS
ncbi:MAG: PEP-CTERM sorting domain-containing protein [Bryobacterales bacterium]|nr:PEP-CTERM sorting domain-containing protein [Bryobacterales bacterium]